MLLVDGHNVELHIFAPQDIPPIKVNATERYTISEYSDEDETETDIAATVTGIEYKGVAHSPIKVIHGQIYRDVY